MDLQLNSLDFVKKGLFAFSVVYSDAIPLRLKVTYLYEKKPLVVDVHDENFSDVS